MAESKKGSKGRKVGRMKRKPAHVRYTMEKRWIKNKKKRIAKQKRIEAKKREKLNGGET